MRFYKNHETRRDCVTRWLCTVIASSSWSRDFARDGVKPTYALGSVCAERKLFKWPIFPFVRKSRSEMLADQNTNYVPQCFIPFFKYAHNAKTTITRNWNVLA